MSSSDREMKLRAWLGSPGEGLDVFTPFLGKCRPLPRRCCQTCTPVSWNAFYHQPISPGFLNAIQVTEEDTRSRGWLARRVCAFLAVWGWKVPADTPRDLPGRICSSRRVQEVTTSQSHSLRGDSRNHQWKEKILEILAETQAPLSLLLLRLCHWALLKLLNCLFLNVLVHRGQLEVVLRAASAPRVPLVFLSRHRSPLDGLLLSFLLSSQGLGVPRVAVSTQGCSPRLRALLRRLGGIFLPWRMEQTLKDWDTPILGAVLATYVEEVLRSRQPLIIFLEEPAVPGQLSAPGREWLALVYRALRDGAVPDVLLVPVGIAYEAVPAGGGEGRARPLGLGCCLRTTWQKLRGSRGCARLDFSQPFSLQEFAAKNLARQSSVGRPREELLLPTILGTCSSLLDGKKAVICGSGPATAAGLEAEEEMLVMELGLHSLSDGIACSAVMAVGIMSALLLHKHQEGVFFSRLMLDFAWLVEETLLRHHDVAFSGQVRVLVQHSLILLRAHVTLYHLSPLGDVLVVPRASAEARRELGQHSAALLPVFASEAVGACALLALLKEILPFLREGVRASEVVLGEDELRRKSLELLQLLPPNLLGLQPCQPLDCQSQDIVDKLLLCGLLKVEKPQDEDWLCDLAPQPCCWLGMDVDCSQGKVPKRCFKLQEPQGSPGFFLFLCRLLSPTLRTYARAVAFLEQPSWPQAEGAYVEALLEFLVKEDGMEHPDRSLALSSLQTFRAMGVLEEMQTPAGPLLQLAQPFQSSTNREKLKAFIQQFAHL